MAESVNAIIGIAVAGGAVYAYMVYSKNTRKRAPDTSVLVDTSEKGGAVRAAVMPTQSIVSAPLNRRVEAIVEPPDVGVSVRPETPAVQEATSGLLASMEPVTSTVVTRDRPNARDATPMAYDLSTLGGRVDNFIATSGILQLQGLRTQHESERIRNEPEWTKHKDLSRAGRGSIIRMTAYRAGLSNAEPRLIDHPMLKELWS